MSGSRNMINRILKHWNTSVLADRLDVDERTVCAWRAGTRQIPRSKVLEIREILGRVERHDLKINNPMKAALIAGVGTILLFILTTSPAWLLVLLLKSVE
jgi:hypothetical protein